MEEKDLFDLFRESSEELTEQPSQDTWQRLETRLARKRTKAVRRPLLLQLNVVVTVVLLLLGVAVIGLYITKMQQANERAAQQFTDLQFLVGKWSASDGKIGDELVFTLEKDAKNAEILRGVKTVVYDDFLVSKDTIWIQKIGQTLNFTHFNKPYKLDKVEKNVFDFGEIRLRKSADDRFSLSFGEGTVFLYKKMELSVN